MGFFYYICSFVQFLTIKASTLIFIIGLSATYMQYSGN